jgi:hypothetical protein
MGSAISGVIVGLGEPVLVPHGIGDDAVEGAELSLLVAEFRVLEGVADIDLPLHVVDDHVHVGHGSGVGSFLLTIELERGNTVLSAFGRLFHGDLAFHQKASGLVV